jgi:hypothetical protein
MYVIFCVYGSVGRIGFMQRLVCWQEDVGTVDGVGVARRGMFCRMPSKLSALLAAALPHYWRRSPELRFGERCGWYAARRKRRFAGSVYNAYRIPDIRASCRVAYAALASALRIPAFTVW